MFVSILQLMGFQAAKPVNSRAGQMQQNKSATARIEGISSRSSNTRQTTASQARARVNSARKKEVKNQTGKIKTMSKVARTPVKVTRGVTSATKPLVKPKAKSVTKAKSIAKVVAKSAVKPKAEPIDKPVKKVVTQSKRGASSKVPVPRALAAKTPVKSGARDKKRKSISKPVAKVVETAPVRVVKPTVKVKVKAKNLVKTTGAKAKKLGLVAHKSKAAAPVAPMESLPIAPLVKPQAAAPVPTAASFVPVRAGRPSSRLAQLTVPSMAQSVASTAAKASFSQALSAPLIVPLLASTIKKNPRLANHWKEKPVEQLSDAEVIAMPDDVYMNETQLAFFRLRLIKLKQDILSNAGITTEHMRADTVVVPDPADRATIEEEHALELRTRDRERKLLKKIEQSIARIDSNDYGYCDETGEPIGVGRLLARPTANLSLEAQQRRELRQKMFGD